MAARRDVRKRPKSSECVIEKSLKDSRKWIGSGLSGTARSARRATIAACGRWPAVFTPRRAL